MINTTVDAKINLIESLAKNISLQVVDMTSRMSSTADLTPAEATVLLIIASRKLMVASIKHSLDNGFPPDAAMLSVSDIATEIDMHLRLNSIVNSAETKATH